MNPPRGVRWENASSLDVHLGGTELNIAANLVSLGTPAAWVSVLPEGEAGEMMRARLRASGVEAQIPLSAPGAPGWYMLEEASRPRSDRVLTRVKSVLGHLPEVALPWEELLKGRKWFHTSGVSAGLSEACTRACGDALASAKRLGLTTSYDLNFRRNLWDEATSVSRQRALLAHVDVLVCSQREVDTYFGGQRPAGKTLLVPQRDELETAYWLEARTDTGTFTSARFPVVVTDRVGVGDSMLAGWIHATLSGRTIQECTRFAGACGALKYSVKGDIARLHAIEVEQLLQDGFKAMQR